MHVYVPNLHQLHLDAEPAQRMREGVAQQDDGVPPEAAVHERVDEDIHEAVAVGEPNEGEADDPRDVDLREEGQKDHHDDVRSPGDEINRRRDAQNLHSLQVT